MMINIVYDKNTEIVNTIRVKLVKKNKSTTSSIRGLEVGQSIRLTTDKCVVRSLIQRLKKLGMTYKTTSTKNINGIIVTRIG